MNMNLDMNLKLDSLSEAAFELVRKWRNQLDGNILRTTQKLTKEMQANFYHNEICNRSSNHRFLGLYGYVKTLKLLACIGIVNIQWENRIGEISIIVNPEEVGKGYGTISFYELLKLGFYSLNLDNIFGECYSCSPHVKFWQKMIQDFNAEITVLPNRKYWNGFYYNSMYFNFNKDQYINIKINDTINFYNQFKEIGAIEK